MMASRMLWIRWVFLLAAMGLLAWNLFYTVSGWSVAGLALCGGMWFALSMRRALALDAKRPR